MILSMFWQDPAVVGLIIAIPGSILGYLGYRRSRGVDEAARQAGMATSQTANFALVITSLQGDNKVLREDIALLRQGVELIQARLEVVETGNTDLRAKNRELEREISVLHSENDVLKAENQKLKARIGELEKANGL